MDIQSRISTTDSRRASLISVLSAKGCSIASSAGLSAIPNAISLIQGGPSYDDMVRGNFSILSGSATSIARYAFKNCQSLRSISFPNCVSVGNDAFCMCRSLSSVNISNCQHIGRSAFNTTAVSTLDLPRVSVIGSSAFGSCLDLAYVRIPGCGIIHDYAFNYCISLESVRLNNVSYIGNYAFEGCDSLSIVKLCYEGIVSVDIIDTIFADTPIDDGDGKIFVPDNWYNSYIADPNWNNYSAYIYRMSEESE